MPGTVDEARDTRSGQSRPSRRRVPSPATTRLTARAILRATRSEVPNVYVRRAPVAGGKTMSVRIGKSRSTSAASEPRERRPRVAVDHPEEGDGEEAHEEHEGHEDHVGRPFPREEVAHLPELLGDVAEEDPLHRVHVIRGRDHDREEGDQDEASPCHEVVGPVRPDEYHELGPEAVDLPDPE